VIATDTQAVEELVRSARNGDRSAFGELYGRFFRMVHGLLLARLPNSEVDDAAQDVFLQAMRQIGNLREAGSFGGWLAQIARRYSAEHFRRRRVSTNGARS
jgi:RNA polymerase sigma-70 factor (ECF subfamily)